MIQFGDQALECRLTPGHTNGKVLKLILLLPYPECRVRLTGLLFFLLCLMPDNFTYQRGSVATQVVKFQLSFALRSWGCTGA